MTGTLDDAVGLPVAFGLIVEIERTQLGVVGTVKDVAVGGAAQTVDANFVLETGAILDFDALIGLDFAQFADVVHAGSDTDARGQGGRKL